MTSTDGRLERERAFHDERFANDTARAATGVFYRAVPDASADYRATVDRCASGRILEYGCGATAIASTEVFDADVVGIDISPVAVELSRAMAEQRNIDASFSMMNAESLTFEDDTFDLVFGSGILHHLDIAVAAGEIGRVIAPGGTAVFLEPMGYNPLINAYRRRTPEMRTDDEHPLMRRDLDVLAAAAPGMDVRFHGLAALGAAPFLDRPGGAQLHRALRAMDRLVLRVPGVRLAAWIAMIELSF